MADQTDAPDGTPTPSSTATPLAGPTVPYTATAAPAPAGAAGRPRRRLGLVIGGIVAASLLVLAAAFGGGVLVGAQVAGPGPGFAVEHPRFPGGPGDGGDPDGGDSSP